MKDLYSLRQVVDLTGLSEFTLRGWENRYQAFTPRRTETGRRLYSGSDLQKAMLLRELIKRDYRIGDIAHLSSRKLSDIMDQAMERAGQQNAPSTKVEAAFKLATLQKWDELEKLLAEEARSASLKVVRGFVFPFMQELGKGVGQGLVTIAQEHIVSALLKQMLYLVRSKSPEAKSQSRVVLASPEGDFHDIGILAAHALLSLHGLHSLFIGSNTPKNELCETSLRYGATHILLASTLSKKEGAREDLATYVHFLDKNLPASTTIWVGGRNTFGFRIKLDRAFECFTSLHQLDEFAARLN